MPEPTILANASATLPAPTATIVSSHPLAADSLIALQEAFRGSFLKPATLARFASPVSDCACCGRETLGRSCPDCCTVAERLIALMEGYPRSMRAIIDYIAVNAKAAGYVA